MIRVLVADVSPLFRRGAAGTLGAEEDMEVVGEAEEGGELLALATHLDPDVVVYGISSLDARSPDVTRSLHLQLPNAGIILISDEDDEELLFEAVKTGVSAYLLKTVPAEEFLSTVRRVARGEHVIDEALMTRPAIASKVLNEFSTLNDDTPQEFRPLLAPLSPREIEILDQICKGGSNKQIARTLAISEQTVKNHITSILKKLAVNDRTEAVIYSLRRGWISVDALGK